ncbi:hypothetical protein FRC18_000262 [Serendipita sp. 400]|nr:hypothetical protein FRC18_000262 [Serendipita sp. 400]
MPPIGCECNGNGTCPACTNWQSQSTLGSSSSLSDRQSPVVPTPTGVPSGGAANADGDTDLAQVVPSADTADAEVDQDATMARGRSGRGRVLACARRVVRGVRTTVQRIFQNPASSSNGDSGRRSGGLRDKIGRLFRR